MITISALAHSTSSIPSRETSNNIGWYASANVSSNSDSDSEEGYTKPYTDPLLVQRNMVWKVLSDGAINTVGRVYEDKDVASCHYTEKQSEEDLPQGNESAVYVDVIDDAERMKQPYEKLLQDNESAVYVDCINDVVGATQTGKGVLSDGAINKVGRVYEDKDVATCHYTEKQSEEDLPKDNESAVYVDVIDDAERIKEPYEKLLQDNESAVYVDCINDVVSATQTGKGVLSDGAINKVGRVYEDKDVATCHYTEKQSEEDLPQDNESAVYVDFIDDAERMKQPYEKLLQDNESAVYVDCINDVVSATQTGKGVLQGGESALYIDLISDAESAMLSDEALPKVHESAARVSSTNYDTIT